MLYFFLLNFIKNSSVLYTYSYNKSKSKAASVSKCLQRGARTIMKVEMSYKMLLNKK